MRAHNVSVHDFGGMAVELRGDLHTSGSAIMLTVAATRAHDKLRDTVLVCEVSDTDAIRSRHLLQAAEYKCTINGNDVDALGDEIIKGR